MGLIKIILILLQWVPHTQCQSKSVLNNFIL
nr:MAG TPA: hypothetical protein [Bacteriophage sp.]